MTSDADVVSVAALGEPIRRALYRFVAGESGPVSREHAAAGVGVALHVAKFHLDKLEQDGLLEVEYSRPPGRGGPGAGRPAKLYRRSEREISVSLPERRYDLAGQLMAKAITSSAQSGVAVTEALRHTAAEAGRELGEHARETAGPRPNRKALVSAVTEVLTDNGYEPRSQADEVTLANCPFHALAQNYTDLVCGMNLELIGGMLEALEQDKLSARLDPGPGHCCVSIRSVSSAGTPDRTKP